MEITSLIPHIEALIFASDKPLTSLDITELLNNAFGFMEDKITLDQVEASLEGILEKYQSEFYPFEVRQSGGGWQFLTKRDYHKTIAQLNGDKFLKRLSAAAMETLSIVAYKQPVTKGEIEAIRGVSSDYAVQKLLEKELIVISGRNETMPGHPLIYTTSKNFMDYFGINNAEDLPKIREVLADQQIEPTSMKDMVQTGEAGDAPTETEDDSLAGGTIAAAEDLTEGATETDGGSLEEGFDPASEGVDDEANDPASEVVDDEANDPASEVADDEANDPESEGVEAAYDPASEELEEAAEEAYNSDEEDGGTEDADDDEADDSATDPDANYYTPDDEESGEEETLSAGDDPDVPATDQDDLLSVTEDGQLIGRMEEDDEEQS